MGYTDNSENFQLCVLLAVILALSLNAYSEYKDRNICNAYLIYQVRENEKMGDETICTILKIIPMHSGYFFQNADVIT